MTFHFPGSPTPRLAAMTTAMTMITAMALALAFMLCPSATLAAGDNKPLNVLWIVSDDLGVELGCYGENAVATPNLDRLASEGVRFTRAFASAPVCSSSRSAFVTGMYQTRIGAHHHRTQLMKPLPEGVEPVMEPFRRAGYFVTNLSPKSGKAGKEDYNFLLPNKPFDGFDWNERAEGQPFFAQVQIVEPHRTFVKNEDPDRPAKVNLPPYYPDRPVTRADWANYLATIEELDRKVGHYLDRLEEEGLTDNTIVFFFGDHGRPHVRGKQWLYEGGIHTPLIIRWPGQIEPGTVDARMVSLIDIVPTTLSAAGLPVPENLDGLNIFADDFTGRDIIFTARDRCGDAPDRIRSARTERFKYIRNFHPELPYTQLSSYKKQQYPVLTLLEVIQEQGRLTPAQAAFMAPTRPEEELYDLENDPHEIQNLAGDPAHAETLAKLRKATEQWITDTGDQSAIPEGDADYMAELMAGKRADFERGMTRRKLDPDLSPRAYLEWWKRDLGLK